MTQTELGHHFARLVDGSVTIAGMIVVLPLAFVAFLFVVLPLGLLLEPGETKKELEPGDPCPSCGEPLETSADRGCVPGKCRNEGVAFVFGDELRGDRRHGL